MFENAEVEISRKLPPVIYLPCTEHVRNPEDAVIEYHSTKDGRVAVLVYSALDRLEFCCGTDQPWLVAPTTMLTPMRQAAAFDLVLLDVVVPEEHRTTLRSPQPRHTTA
ncbi:hypothetical protein SAMN05216266_112135 [Amycolatopsis marina]|uniref:SseB protein N-terminal domain-containing protein n=1 Tax=Amycolatopsis marina TaxID=490629 RepID=A0A1I1B6X1_9PSEU|nr:hypothetical protein SAMN05216266_112135 [Amycolatopsis marina]